MFTYISPWSPPPRWRGKEGTRRPPLSCCLPPFPSRETEPRSFFLFLPGLNKDLVGAENCISESELSFEAHRLGLSAFLGVGTSWRTPGATWVLAGGLGCKSQDTGHMDNAQGIHTCEPGRRPLLLFQPVAPTPRSLLRFQGLDWTDFGGETKVRHGQGLQSGEPQARD